MQNGILLKKLFSKNNKNEKLKEFKVIHPLSLLE